MRGSSNNPLRSSFEHLLGIRVVVMTEVTGDALQGSCMFPRGPGTCISVKLSPHIHSTHLLTERGSHATDT